MYMGNGRDGDIREPRMPSLSLSSIDKPASDPHSREVERQNAIGILFQNSIQPAAQPFRPARCACSMQLGYTSLDLSSGNGG